MAIRRRKLIREKTASGLPPENRSAGEISLSPATATDNAGQFAAASPVPVNTRSVAPEEKNMRPKQPAVIKGSMNLLQYTLGGVAGICVILLAYSFIYSSFSTGTPRQAGAKTQKIPVAEETDQTARPEDAVAKNLQAEESNSAQKGALSLQQAETFFASQNYISAYNVYNQLRQKLVTADTELIKDFLLLRMAICAENKGYFDKALEHFKAAAESRSVAVRAIADYRCAVLEMKEGRYLNARTRAYKTLCLIPALSSDFEWALKLERDSTFLAAEAVTRQVLSLCDADKGLPSQLWPRTAEKELPAGLDETKLKELLNAGIEKLNPGLLAPQIRLSESTAGSSGLTRWSVVCNGPGIKELMARFAANAALDVKWIYPPDTAALKTSGYNMPVVLYLPSATTQQVAANAAGAVGLLAQIDDANTVTITNPAEYSALSEHTRMLGEHAIWLWRKLLLMYSDDQRIANVHFALGILQSRKNQVAEAIAEYKLVANRYPNCELAPYALLGSSRLKAGLRDYTGSSRDLKQLIEQYPDNELIGQANLELAETTMKAGLYEQACSIYRKTYNLGLSNESQSQAGFGAGRCYYELKDYESAVKWLTRYIDTAIVQKNAAQDVLKQQSQASSNVYTAYLLLGKSHLVLGNLTQACDALNRTMRRAASSDEYIEAVTTLIETHVKQENFVEALSIIENVRSWPFSQEQVTRLLMLKSNVLHKMGLTSQAVTLLTDRVQYLTDNQLKAAILLELARYHLADNNLDLARNYLTETLALVEPGETAYQASVQLAEVCLKLGDDRQVISICGHLFDSPASEKIKQQCSKILASIYSKQQEYDKAAMTLMTNAK